MRHAKNILVVDDDLNILEVIEARLTSAAYSVYKAASGRAALDIMRKHAVDLLISDMKMPGMGGMELLAEARKLKPDLPVIFLTAYGTIEGAVSALKAGALDYLTKPFNGRKLLAKVQDILSRQATALPDDGRGKDANDSFFVGESQAMRALYDVIRRVADSDVNVLILGDSGVGKEYVARQVHRLSSRSEHPFVVVDCGATPAGLLESELFGHMKGAFTDAIRDKKGLIAAADQGTLLLDEIGNISAEMQIRLLRFLEDRKIRRIGDLEEIAVDCRVIAATNAYLREEVKSGRFREDLYYRLRVVTLKIPPLKDRKEDIPALARAFAKRFCQNQGMPTVELPPATIRWLCEYPWPGNVRELKNAIEAGVVLCQGKTLAPDDLKQTGLPEFVDNDGQSEAPLSLEASERDTIIRALQEVGGVQSKAAELLGISRRAIHYKIKKYGIDPAALRLSRGESH